MINGKKLFSSSIALLPSGPFYNNLFLQQFSRFIFIGLFNTLLGYGTFLIFLDYSSYIVSLIAAHVVGVLNSFIWNKYWTFRSVGLKRDEFIKFNIVYVIYFLINVAILTFLINDLNFSPQIGQLIALPILTFVSFAGQKYWSFKKNTT